MMTSTYWPAADRRAGPTRADFGLVVYERSGWWARRLRACLGELIDVAEVRSVDELLSRLETLPAAIVVVELDLRALEASLAWLEIIDRRWPEVRVVVVACRGLSAYEPILREFGVIHFETAPRSLKHLEQLARRRHASLGEPRLGLVERIWSRLPWPQHGHRGGSNRPPLE